jgi:LCP family protein required for cell wall assembly
MSTRNLKIIKLITIGLVILSASIGISYLVFFWNQPLNPALEQPQITLPNQPETLNPINSDSHTPSTDLTATPTIEPVCGGPPSMTVLISGVASSDYLYGLADAIRIARIDFQNPEVSVLALPRDLWVNIPGLESRGITFGKLNQAYFYGTEGMGYYEGPGFGAGLLAETLFTNYGLRIDHYLSVNLNSFRLIIDSMGGIDVTLPQDVYKRVNDQPVLFLKAGPHHLNGKQAEMLTRQRITIGDFGRINNQTIVLKAVAANLLSPAGISSLPVLVDQLRSNVETDFSPAEISQLICLADMIDFQEDVTFITLPEDLMVEQMVFDPTRSINTAALIGNVGEISELLNDFQQGN